MKFFYSVLILCLAFMFTSCKTAEKQVAKEAVKEATVLTGDYNAIGIGEPDSGANNKISRKQTSFVNAKKAALKDMETYIYSVRLESGKTIKESAKDNTNVKPLVDEILKNAKITKKEWDSSDSCIVTLGLNLKELKSKLAQMDVK